MTTKRIETGQRFTNLPPGEEIVISGLSGHYPECNSVKELEVKLHNKVNLIVEPEWKRDPEVPHYVGRVSNILKYDVDFFGTDYKLATVMDSSIKLVLERTYEAIIDAGLNPKDFKNMRVGIFAPICFVNTDLEVNYDKYPFLQNGLAGTSRSSVPAFIADWLGLKCTVLTCDAACSTSIYAIDSAFRAIQQGQCDVAIVAGSNLSTHPTITTTFKRLGILSPDGQCKCFDERANGYVRSEAVVSCILQKSKHAKRAYAQLVYTKTNCDGYKSEGIHYPSAAKQKQLLKQFYEECDVSTADLTFWKLMLLLCIAFHSGYMPPNINLETQRKSLKALTEGRLQVVTEKIPWNGVFAAISSFGFGGANGHLLLKRFTQQKINNGLPDDDLPRLVCISGSTEAAVSKIFDDLISRTVDVDEIRLWHGAYSQHNEGHNYKGFILLRSTPVKALSIHREIQRVTNSNQPRPICFIYSDIVSQLHHIHHLMKIPVFEKIVQRCAKAIMETTGIDLVKATTDSTYKGDDKSLKSLIAVAVQVGLTAILKAVGITPNYIIGYGSAKLVCDYARDHLSAEETIMLCCNGEKPVIKPTEEKSNKNESSSNEDNSTLCFLIPDSKDLNSFHTKQKENNEINNNGDNNTKKSVEEAIKKLPEDTIIIEITQDILHQTSKQLSRNMTYINLCSDLSEDILKNIFVSLGKSVYEKYEQFMKRKTFQRRVTINLDSERYDFMLDHYINGCSIFPASGYLHTVWLVFCDVPNIKNDIHSVIFEDVKFLRVTPLRPKMTIEFNIVIQKLTGEFEILESNSLVCTGKIYTKENIAQDFIDIPEVQENETDMKLTAKDFYKELHLRGYGYRRAFQGVLSVAANGEVAKLNWVNNWVVFLDSMLQLGILGVEARNIYLPSRIEKLSIDIEAHFNALLKISPDLTKSSLNCCLNRKLGIVLSGGVEIRGIHAFPSARNNRAIEPTIQSYEFVPNFFTELMPFDDALHVALNLIYENIQTSTIKVIEVIDDDYEKSECKSIITKIGDLIDNLPKAKKELLVMCNDTKEMPKNVTVQNSFEIERSDAIILVGSNLLKRYNVLSKYNSTLQKNGFFISREKKLADTCDVPKGYIIVSKIKCDTEYLVLIRKENLQAYNAIIKVDDSFSWVNDTKEVLSKYNEIVFYAQHDLNGLLGFFKCLKLEFFNKNMYCVLINDSSAPIFDTTEVFYKNQLKKGLIVNVYQDGQWGTYRHLNMKTLNELTTVSHAFIKVTNIPNLKSIAWVEGSLSNTVEDPEMTTVDVYYAALNFRDVMVATGRVPVDAVAHDRLAQETVIGFEACGKTTSKAIKLTLRQWLLNELGKKCGTRCVTLYHGGISNKIRCPKDTLLPIPDEWTMKEGATIYSAYSTAYLSMIIIGKIKRRESILIHAGTGAVGQAAITLALYYGCEVFTTVGTPEKRDFLKKLFPQIKDSHIGNTRDTSFEEMIKTETKGKGVDLVLNSLAEEKLMASMRCLGRRGRFLEIGKVDIYKNSEIEMTVFEKEISIHGIMLDYMNCDWYIKIIKRISKEIFEGINNGTVKPITYCLFDKEEVGTAFRYMATGKHMGKVLIEIRDEKNTTIAGKPIPLEMKAVPRYTCSPKFVYIVIGGLGGFGLELIDWLILRDARKVLIVSSRGITDGYQFLRIRTWKSYKCDIQISTHDVTTELGCEEMLSMANSMGPVEAIFNLAAVLKDGPFQTLTVDDFEISFSPKAVVTKHLDKLSRKLCPGLRDFVVFSSIISGMGNAAQANYGYSNSVMERICESRKREGLPGLAIQWGAIGDVGLVANIMSNNNESSSLFTFGLQSIRSCLQTLDTLLKHKAAVLTSYVLSSRNTDTSGCKTVVEVVAKIMGIKDLKTVSQQTPLSEMGMDSITAVEIKHTLERDYQIFLNPQEVRTLTFAKLNEISLKKNDSLTDSTKALDINALRLFINMIENESDIPKESCVHMKTLKESDSKTLFIIPGLDGIVKNFKTLCSQLKCKVFVLRYSSESAESMVQISNELYENIRPMLSIGEPFNLLGYSFGTWPALNLAARLESEGFKGIVFCLDGSPTWLKDLVTSKVYSTSENEIQMELIVEVYRLIDPNVRIPLDELKKREQFDEKIDYCLNVVQIKTKNSSKYIKTILKSYYNRILFVRNSDLKETEVVQSRIVLIRSAFDVIECEKDYALNKFTNDKVEVFTVKTDHLDIKKSEKVANILNNFL